MTRRVYNNVGVGRRFAQTARALLAEDMAAAESKAWLRPDQILDMAELFRVRGVFSFDREHTRLVLRINRDDTLQIYDPLFSREGKQIYAVPVDKSHTIIPSHYLQKDWDIRGNELDCSGPARLALLREKGYRLDLPAGFADERLQRDGYNCGPLAVYAALVACKHTPPYDSRVDFAKLKDVCGIEIA